MSDKEWLFWRRFNRIFHLTVIIVGSIYFFYTWTNPSAMRYFFVGVMPIGFVILLCGWVMNMYDWIVRRKRDK
ncbi:hypothetical protein I4Q36_09935 [Tuanshanicoccus lijuaniae]|uniref:hypothetical protein n=1 Tax=Aerococcaceae bacterium zg-1292 TaxID=2774330 RepID=UPI0019351095|nr:hypothetical protein [Aerococcaceae bacterium zg-1292]MBF6626387.1 hypothetical protein [Aerococcaceae bacterium zg-BR9]QQA37065.1 hypothetical protein I4Q36_09935 [Aerococcaceae bacterium zg-1292]